METCADEWRDTDGRGGGLAMAHGHLHGPRAAHHHVRQQRDRARCEGEWEGAEVDAPEDRTQQRVPILFYRDAHTCTGKVRPSVSDTLYTYEG